MESRDIAERLAEAAPAPSGRYGPPLHLLLAAVAAVAATLLIHWTTTVGLVDTWSHSVTYNHGFLVAPVSAWLLWRNRANFAGIDWKPWWPALAGFLVLGLLWFLGYAANIKSFRDLALVASIPMTLVVVLGRDFARRAPFQLLFLLFAWPFGEVFIPQLIDLTADFTVVALRISGVPVFREGSNFVIPSGEWSVVQECSGVRYLLVSLFAGSLFAYLSFRSNRRRVAFVGLAVLVPVIANWLRAYGIVLLAHFSNNELAVGVDHLIYGWVFFGIVMTALFYFGVRFMGEPPLTAPPTIDARGASPGTTAPATSWISAIAVAVLVAIPPLAAARIDAIPVPPASNASLSLPESFGVLTRTSNPPFGWNPTVGNPTDKVQGVYAQDGRNVEVHLARYATDSGASKLATFEAATMVDFDSKWRMQRRSDRSVSELSPALRVTEREVRSRGVRLLVWQWSLVGGFETGGFLDSKWALIRSRLSGDGSDSTAVALVTSIRDDDVDAARSQLLALAPLVRERLAGDRGPGSRP
jgi:exosortase A